MTFKAIITSFIILLATTLTVCAQEKNSLEKKWFIGVEMGSNSVFLKDKSFQKNFQGGVFTEYYYTKNFSLTIRFKKYKKGYDELLKIISSDIIAIPVLIKWEINFIKKLKLDAFLGLTFLNEKNIVYEVVEEYQLTSKGTVTTLGSGLGATYFFTNKIGMYFNFENNLNFIKNNGNTKPLFLYNKNYSHLNFGVKYRIN